MISRELLSTFQVNCINKIKNAISSGSKRISVIVPVGSGTCVLSYHLAKELASRVAFATSFRQIERKLENNISEYGLNVTSVENADVIICHNLFLKTEK